MNAYVYWTEYSFNQQYQFHDLSLFQYVRQNPDDYIDYGTIGSNKSQRVKSNLNCLELNPKKQVKIRNSKATCHLL